MIPRSIIKDGHPTLRQVAKPVPLPLSKEDADILKDMMGHLKMSKVSQMAERFHLRPGIGLAAPQINISKRMFVIHFNDLDDTHHEFCFVNPEIIEPSQEMVYLPFGEGCLSVDRVVDGLVMRHKEVQVKTVLYDPATESTRHVKMVLRGYVAIVFQHELDHLDGVMFYDRAVELPTDDAKPLYEITDLEDE